MGVMEQRRSILLNEPHPETKSGQVVNFETDISGLMEITGSGNIYTLGSNLIDDTKRFLSGASLFIGATNDSYEVYLRNGTYTITAEILNNDYHHLYVRSNTSSYQIWSKESQTTTQTFTLSTSGLYRFDFYDSDGVNSANIGRVWLNYGDTALQYEECRKTFSQALQRKTLTGINNVFAEEGQVTVKYWTH